ncbi:MAG TPA: hypothetical protein DEA08_34610, partial [Planctomycetes bacterium]|nr:hypothetical protein [Planctomycetota bacterium]
SKTIDRPERLLPLVEQAIFSRHGSFEWGTVGQGGSALREIAKRATTPGPVLDTIEKIRTQYPRSQTRWEYVWEANTLAKRFPAEVLPRLVPLLNDASSGVREIGLDAIKAGVRRMGLVPGIMALESLLPQVPERHQRFLLEDARSLLYRAQQIPMSELPALRASLDELVSQIKSPELQAALREVRSELTTRAMERQGKSDRFADYRRVDGSLQWGELFKAKLGLKPKGGGENYSNPRRGASGEVVKGFLPDVVASEVFKTVHQAAQAQAQEALAKAKTPAERALLQSRVKALEGLSVRYLETNDITARRSGKVIQVSYGLLHEVYARSMRLMEAGKVTAGERGMYQARVLGLVFGHEVAHASGMKAERAADALGVRTVWSSLLKPQNQAQAEVALKSTIELFEQPTGAKAFDNLLYRIKNFFRYGTPRGRLEALRRAAKGQPDPLQRFRRGDGTVEWKKVAAERAAREAAGVAKFGLALFLKELAIVAQTGDKARIEEFFDYVLSTDFYKHY